METACGSHFALLVRLIRDVTKSFGQEISLSVMVIRASANGREKVPRWWWRGRGRAAGVVVSRGTPAAGDSGNDGRRGRRRDCFAGTTKRGQSQDDIDARPAVRRRIVRFGLLSQRTRSLPGHWHPEIRCAEDDGVELVGNARGARPCSLP